MSVRSCCYCGGEGAGVGGGAVGSRSVRHGSVGFFQLIVNECDLGLS